MAGDVAPASLMASRNQLASELHALEHRPHAVQSAHEIAELRVTLNRLDAHIRRDARNRFGR